MTPFCQIPGDGASAPFPLWVPMCLASWTMFFAANSFFSQPIIGVFGCRRANMAMSAIGFQLPGEGHLLLVATPPDAYGVISSTLNMGR